MKEKLSPALKHGLSTGLIILSLILASCIYFFITGCRMIFDGSDKIIWLWTILISFFIAIPIMAKIVKSKTEIDRFVDIGQPVYIAAEYVKDIMKKVNVFGVASLQDVMKKAMEYELKKLVEDREGRKK